MAENAAPVLTSWSKFYILAGSAAAALTGLMFVVITLVNRPDSARSDEGVATFTTPTVMHFAGALLVSALLIAPWHSLVTVATLLGFASLYGVLHMLRVVFRARRLNRYNPDLEDWISYGLLPTLAYGAICAGAIRLPTAPVQALFAIGGGVVLATLHRYSQRLGPCHVPRCAKRPGSTDRATARRNTVTRCMHPHAGPAARAGFASTKCSASEWKEGRVASSRGVQVRWHLTQICTVQIYQCTVEHFRPLASLGTNLRQGRRLA